MVVCKIDPSDIGCDHRAFEVESVVNRHGQASSIQPCCSEPIWSLEHGTMCSAHAVHAQLYTRIRQPCMHSVSPRRGAANRPTPMHNMFTCWPTLNNQHLDTGVDHDHMLSTIKNKIYFASSRAAYVLCSISYIRDDTFCNGDRTAIFETSHWLHTECAGLLIVLVICTTDRLQTPNLTSRAVGSAPKIELALNEFAGDGLSMYVDVIDASVRLVSGQDACQTDSDRKLLATIQCVTISCGSCDDCWTLSYTKAYTYICAPSHDFNFLALPDPTTLK